MLEVALSPLGLYIFFASPVLNRLIRALILRDREFRADAYAAWLTDKPEASAYAMAKIGGVATVLGKSIPSSLPAHTGISDRIEHLMGMFSTYTFNGLEAAIAKAAASFLLV